MTNGATVADAVAGVLVPASLSVAVTLRVNVAAVAQVCATATDVPPVTDCTGVPSPQSIANVNPAAVSAAEASVALNVIVAGAPAMIPGGTFATAAVGATLVIVSVDVAVDTDGPSVTWRPIVTTAGPSSRPSPVSVVVVTVGFGPVASSNWPSLSRSHAKLAVGPAAVALASSVKLSPSATVYGPPASGTTRGATPTDVVAGVLVPPSLSVAVTVTGNVPAV